MFHAENRALQDRFGSRALADRLVETRHRTAFTAEDAAFVAACPFFFLATADAEGRPDCSFKGGDPGFVRVLAPDLLAFPDYDGNGMFKSLGQHPRQPGGRAAVHGLRPRRAAGAAAGERHRRKWRPRTTRCCATSPGGQLLVRVRPLHIFPNCPRYIPDLAPDALALHAAPRLGAAGAGVEGRAVLRDVVPPRRVPTV
jgi:hypothetical protein